MTQKPNHRRNDVRTVRLQETSVLRVSGSEARTFLHAQLSNDIQHLSQGDSRIAGWCSPKGRLLCVFRVIPEGETFLLQLPTALASSIARRLGMFVLRAKVSISDVTAEIAQIGVFGAGADVLLNALPVPVPERDNGVEYAAGLIILRFNAGRFLLLVDQDREVAVTSELELPVAAEAEWTLEDIRGGIPVILPATQDQFVPQMVNFERIGGIDFKKGCYPGQEVVARAQYRGQVKQRMAHGLAPVGTSLVPGQDLYGVGEPVSRVGTLVLSAPSNRGVECLAVVNVAALAQETPIRSSSEGPPLSWLQLPDSA